MVLEVLDVERLRAIRFQYMQVTNDFTNFVARSGNVYAISQFRAHHGHLIAGGTDTYKGGTLNARMSVEYRLNALGKQNTPGRFEDRKSTRLNSSHNYISYSL